MSIMNVAQLLPKQLYVENVVSVMKRELLDECDYLREANCCNRFSKLVENDSVFKVPKIYFDLTTKDILVAELIDGEPFDKCISLDQEQRNFVFKNFILFLFLVDIINFTIRLAIICFVYV
jgi:aarF domain-containing kinase